MPIKRTQSILFSSVLVTGILAFGLGWFFANNASSLPKNQNNTVAGETAYRKFEPAPKIKNLDEVWDILQNSYYDGGKLDAAKMAQGAQKGFVSGIGDPYTVFMTPEESKDFENGLDGQLEGIGAELEIKDGKLVVVTPLKNSPASDAGLKPGDIVEKINGAIVEEMTFYDAIKKIRGKKGTKVTLTITRAGLPDSIDLTITRREIILESITIKKLDGDIFYLVINQFNDHTKSEFLKAAEDMLLAKAAGLILDVRGNGGGYLDIAVDILSELIAGEKPIVIIKKKNKSESEEIKTGGSARLADIPLVVLINKGSASASEILAGALQDYRRAVLIGETTFGKGSVQEIDRLKDGSNLRFTIAKWFTPLNRSIDEVGIKPDIELKFTEEDLKQNRDPQLERAVEYIKTL